MTTPIFQLLLDGAADRSIGSLGNKTPLQAARTPNLDALAEAGASGLMEVGPPGVPLHSPAAHGLLWGLDLTSVPPRSLLEIHGAGFDARDHDAVFFFYLVAGRTGADGWHVTRRLPASGKHDPIADHLPSPVSLEAGGHRWRFDFRSLGRPNSGVALVDGEGWTFPPNARLTDSDPFQDDYPLIAPEPMEGLNLGENDRHRLEAYVGAIRAIIRRSADWLSDSPDHDFMAPKWHAPAERPSPPTLKDRWGLDGATDSPKHGVKGLADLMGMEVLDPEGAADYEERVMRAVEALEAGRDFVHCHFPEPDAPGHEGNPEGKREVLERIDRVLDPLVDRRKTWLICVTPDHSTPCQTAGEHGGDSVPVLLTGPDTRRDDEATYDEIAAGRGALGTLRARTLMPRMLDLTGRSLMYEVRRHPSDPAHRSPPGDVHPFVP